MLPACKRVSCRIQQSATKGRYVVTNEAAAPGDILMEDMPLLSTVDFESFPRELVQVYGSLSRPDSSLSTSLFPPLHPCRVLLFSFTCPIPSCRHVHIIDPPLFSHLKRLTYRTRPSSLPEGIAEIYSSLPGGPCAPILTPHHIPACLLPSSSSSSSSTSLPFPHAPLSPLYPCSRITPFLLPLLPAVAALNRIAHACGVDAGFPHSLLGSVLAVWVDVYQALTAGVTDVAGGVTGVSFASNVESEHTIENTSRTAIAQYESYTHGPEVKLLSSSQPHSRSHLWPLSLHPLSPLSTLSLLLRPRAPFAHTLAMPAVRQAERQAGIQIERQTGIQVENHPVPTARPPPGFAPVREASGAGPEAEHPASSPSSSCSLSLAPSPSSVAVFALAMQPDAPMRARTRAIYTKLSRMVVDVLPNALVMALGPGIGMFTQNVQVSPQACDFSHCTCVECVQVTPNGCLIDPASVDRHSKYGCYDNFDHACVNDDNCHHGNTQSGVPPAFPSPQSGVPPAFPSPGSQPAYGSSPSSPPHPPSPLPSPPEVSCSACPSNIPPCGSCAHHALLSSHARAPLAAGDTTPQLHSSRQLLACLLAGRTPATRSATHFSHFSPLSARPPPPAPPLAALPAHALLCLALHALCDVLDTNVFNADGATLPVDVGVWGAGLRLRGGVKTVPMEELAMRPQAVGATEGTADAGLDTAAAAGVVMGGYGSIHGISGDVGVMVGTESSAATHMRDANMRFPSPLPALITPVPKSGIFLFRIKTDCLFPRVAMMEHACVPVAVVRECHWDDDRYVRYVRYSPEAAVSSSSPSHLHHDAPLAQSPAASPASSPSSATPPPVTHRPSLCTPSTSDLCTFSLSTLPTLFRVVASLPLPPRAPVAIAYRLLSGLPRSQRHKQTYDSYGFPCGCALCSGVDVGRGCFVGYVCTDVSNVNEEVVGHSEERRQILPSVKARERWALSLFFPIHPDNLQRSEKAQIPGSECAGTSHYSDGSDAEDEGIGGADDGGDGLPLTTVLDPALRHCWLPCTVSVRVRGCVGHDDNCDKCDGNCDDEPVFGGVDDRDHRSAHRHCQLLCEYSCQPAQLARAYAIDTPAAASTAPSSSSSPAGSVAAVSAPSPPLTTQSSSPPSHLALPLLPALLPTPTPPLRMPLSASASWLLLEYLWWQVAPPLRAHALTRVLLHTYYTQCLGNQKAFGRAGTQSLSEGITTMKSPSGSGNVGFTPLISELPHSQSLYTRHTPYPCSCSGRAPQVELGKTDFCISCELGKVRILQEKFEIPDPEEDMLSLSSPLSFPISAPAAFLLPLPPPELYVTAVGYPHPEESASLGDHLDSRKESGACSPSRTFSTFSSLSSPASSLHLLGQPVPVPLPVSFLPAELHALWVTLHTRTEKYFQTFEKQSRKSACFEHREESDQGVSDELRKTGLAVWGVSSQHYTLLEAISQVLGMTHSSFGMSEFRYRVDFPGDMSEQETPQFPHRAQAALQANIEVGVSDGCVSGYPDSEFTPHLKFPPLSFLMTSSLLWDASSFLPCSQTPSSSSSPTPLASLSPPASTPSTSSSPPLALPLLLLLAGMQASQLLLYGPAHWATVDTVALRASTCATLADAMMYQASHVWEALVVATESTYDDDECNENVSKDQLDRLRDLRGSITGMKGIIEKTLPVELRDLHLHQYQQYTVHSGVEHVDATHPSSAKPMTNSPSTLLGNMGILLSMSTRWRAAAHALLNRAYTIGAVVADADKARSLKNMYLFQDKLLREMVYICSIITPDAW